MNPALIASLAAAGLVAAAYSIALLMTGPATRKQPIPFGPFIFADGLDRLFAINSFPTVVVVDRSGKIVYRAEGYGEDTFEQALSTAVNQALTGSTPAPNAISSNR